MPLTNLGTLLEDLPSLGFTCKSIRVYIECTLN